jgi:hypothetical protein
MLDTFVSWLVSVFFLLSGSAVILTAVGLLLGGSFLPSFIAHNEQDARQFHIFALLVDTLILLILLLISSNSYLRGCVIALLAIVSITLGIVVGRVTLTNKQQKHAVQE